MTDSKDCKAFIDNILSKIDKRNELIDQYSTLCNNNEDIYIVDDDNDIDNLVYNKMEKMCEIMDKLESVSLNIFSTLDGDEFLLHSFNDLSASIHNEEYEKSAKIKKDIVEVIIN